MGVASQERDVCVRNTCVGNKGRSVYLGDNSIEARVSRNIGGSWCEAQDGLSSSFRSSTTSPGDDAILLGRLFENAES